MEKFCCENHNQIYRKHCLMSSPGLQSRPTFVIIVALKTTEHIGISPDGWFDVKFFEEYIFYLKTWSDIESRRNTEAKTGDFAATPWNVIETLREKFNIYLLSLISTERNFLWNFLKVLSCTITLLRKVVRGRARIQIPSLDTKCLDSFFRVAPIYEYFTIPKQKRKAFQTRG